MKLIVNNGKVSYIMVAGSDFVTSEMSEEAANKLLTEGKKRASNRFPGYPVCVDSKYFFAAVSDKAAKAKCEKE